MNRPGSASLPGAALRTPSPARLALAVGLLALGLADLAYIHMGLVPRYFAAVHGLQIAHSARALPVVAAKAMVATPRASPASPPLPVQAKADAPGVPGGAVMASGLPATGPSAPVEAASPVAAAAEKPLEPIASARPVEGYPDLLFARNTTWLSAVSRAILDRLAQMLKQSPTRRVVLRGHTDCIGSPDLNRWLSRARARKAAGYLEARGVEPVRIDIEFLGSNQPAATEHTPTAGARNRRVEIEIH
jgi:outer membrane protein OmpA-like peptidoglycan-associated protein